MKDYIELIKNITNIFGILFAGLILLFLFPDTLENFRIYILSFLIVTLIIVIIRYIYSAFDLYSIFKGASLIELLIIQKCLLSEIQSLSVQKENPIYKFMQDLVIKNIFFKPLEKDMQTDLFVMYNSIFDLLQNKLVRTFLAKSIRRKNSARANEFLEYLTSHMVDDKIDELIAPRK